MGSCSCTNQSCPGDKYRRFDSSREVILAESSDPSKTFNCLYKYLTSTFSPVSFRKELYDVGNLWPFVVCTLHTVAQEGRGWQYRQRRLKGSCLQKIRPPLRSKDNVTEVRTRTDRKKNSRNKSRCFSSKVSCYSSNNFPPLKDLFTYFVTVTS